MKIIFLDIDGVLNSGRTATAYGDVPHGFSIKDRDYYDWVSVALIRKLCLTTKSKCVLSSSWRINHHYEEVANFFDLPIIDSTPHSSGIIKSASGFSLMLAQKRGDEIELWLAAHPDTQYIIIDDNDETVLDQKNYFIHVNHSEGFSYINYQNALKLLK